VNILPPPMKMFRPFLLCVSTCAIGADAGFRPLFNGKDLSGWDGNPAVWSVRDGSITGVTQGPESLRYNEFIICRGGTFKNFELRAKVRQSGNNSGIQFRSKELPAVGRWAVGGYQCDIQQPVKGNGKLYEERFRTTLAENGQSVVIDPQGMRWLVAERQPVSVDCAEWNEFTIVAQGHHVIQKINGKVTAEVWDFETGAGRSEGIIALQIHRGPAMTVQMKDVEIKELPDIAAKPFDRALIPTGAKKIDPPASPTPPPRV
jgi:hypothetical protein